MKHFSNLSALEEIKSDPELYREIYGYISYCISELLEYADEDDLADHDCNMFPDFHHILD